MNFVAAELVLEVLSPSGPLNCSCWFLTAYPQWRLLSPWLCSLHTHRNTYKFTYTCVCKYMDIIEYLYVYTFVCIYINMCVWLLLYLTRTVKWSVLLVCLFLMDRRERMVACMEEWDRIRIWELGDREEQEICSTNFAAGWFIIWPLSRGVI